MFSKKKGKCRADDEVEEMSDVIEAMEEAIDVTGDVVTALKVAEEQGWRLVPVEGTEHQLNVLAEVYEERGDSFAYRETIQAAPRPWDNSDE